MNIPFRSLTLTLALGLAAASSQAGIARFDTTSFGYTATGGTLSWSAPDAYQVLDTEAAAAGGTLGSDAQNNTLFNWADGSVMAATAYSSATASATGQAVQGSAQATRTSLASADPLTHTSRANASQSGVFSLSADGNVTFTLGWQIQVDGAATDPGSDIAHALMSFTAGLYDNSVTTSYTEELFSYDSLTGMAMASGIWSVTVALAAGELGYYDLSGTASAEAAAAFVANEVPEPGSLALLAVGLGGLWSARRRRSARTA